VHQKACKALQPHRVANQLWPLAVLARVLASVRAPQPQPAAVLERRRGSSSLRVQRHHPWFFIPHSAPTCAVLQRFKHGRLWTNTPMWASST